MSYDSQPICSAGALLQAGGGGIAVVADLGR